MEQFILIRDYKPGDELQCYEVVKEGMMSTVNSAFLAGLTRELTFQLMVLLSAILFIFFSVPFGFCLASIPGVIVFIYFCIWSAHKFKVVAMSQDISNISRIYMSSNFTGFWVAEAYESQLRSDKTLLKYPIVTAKEFKKMNLKTNHYIKKIVGTVAVTKSKSSEDCAWLRRMAVTRDYQRKGIASALLDVVLEFCRARDYCGVDLITTECHETARTLYVKKGFDVQQMYHRHIFLTLVSVLIYELRYELKKK